MRKLTLLLILILSIAALGAYQTTPNTTPAFYVYDGFGGLHMGNDAPFVTGLPYEMNDIFIDVEVVSYTVCMTTGKVTHVGVWALDQYGTVHASNGAPAPATPTPYFGFKIARDLELVQPPVRYSGC